MKKPHQRSNLCSICAASLVTTVLVVCCAFQTSCIEETTIDAENNVLVGLLLPFTGGDAALGAAYERAALMIKDTVNEAGGIGGKPIVFVSRDTFSDQDRAKKSIEEILSYPVAAVLGPESPEISRELIAASMKKKITVISPVVSGASTIEIPKGFNWFRLAPSTAILGRAFANYLHNEGFVSFAAVYSTEDYHFDFAQAFAKRISELGGNVTEQIVLTAGATSFRSEIDKLEQSGTPNVLLSASTADAARFMNNLLILEKSSEQKWFLSPPLETSVLLNNTDKGAFDGAIGIGIKVHDESQDFKSSFQSRWKDMPIDGAYYYYDAMCLLALALEKTVIQNNGKIEFENLQQMLRQTARPLGMQVQWNRIEQGLSAIRKGDTIHYSGLTGSIIFDDFGQQIISPMKVWQITSENFVNISEL